MKTIIYHAEGTPIADAHAEAEAFRFLQGDASEISVSTSNFVTAVRVLVSEGKFPHDQVTLFFKGGELRLDRDGRLTTSFDRFL